VNPRHDPDAVIDGIYEAASEPHRWADVLEGAGKHLKVDALLLLYCNVSVGRPRVIEAVGFDNEALDAFGADNLWNDEFIGETIGGPIGVIVSSDGFAKAGDFSSTRISHRLLVPSGLGRMVGAAAVSTPKVHASLWAARSEGSREFSVHDLCAFRELLPHVARAMTMHHRVRQAELRATMAAGAFDRVAAGVVLLDLKGAPVMVNREAERIVAMQDGFSLLGDGPVAARTSQTKALRDLIDHVREVPGLCEETGRGSGGAIRLTRMSGRPDYHVVVLPLPKRCQPDGGSGAVVVLFITDPDKSQNPVDYLFGELYGLTEAELRLVSLLLKGGGLTAAAEHLGLSRNTVHSQLASVFQKTGTRRQSGLLRLLLGGVAPVKPPDETSGFAMAVAETRPNPE
jgi:DNA-binding CsgD family transcriptional regulator